MSDTLRLPSGYFIRRGAYRHGPVMLLWCERLTRCDVVLESTCQFLSYFARERKINSPDQAFLLLAYATRTIQ